MTEYEKEPARERERIEANRKLAYKADVALQEARDVLRSLQFTAQSKRMRNALENVCYKLNDFGVALLNEACEL